MDHQNLGGRLRLRENPILSFYSIFIPIIPAVTFEGFFQSLRLRSLQLNEVHSRGLRGKAAKPSYFQEVTQVKKLTNSMFVWMFNILQHSLTFF